MMFSRALLAVTSVAIVPIAIGVLSASSMRTQGQVRRTFEVASVKAASVGFAVKQLDRQRYRDTGSLLAFIVDAYRLGGSCFEKVRIYKTVCPLISGTMPGWATSDSFEIQAKVPDDFPVSGAQGRPDQQQFSLMFQALLEDRFHVKVHWETKEVPVWALTVAKSGPKLQKAEPHALVKLPDGTETEWHGRFGDEPVRGQPGRRRITFKGSTMQQVAEGLAPHADEPVVDKTGLSGEYDFTVEYDTDQGALIGTPALNCPTLSSALQGVGLRCESTKAPIQVLVVDHVERPAEN